MRNICVCLSKWHNIHVTVLYYQYLVKSSEKYSKKWRHTRSFQVAINCCISISIHFMNSIFYRSGLQISNNPTILLFIQDVSRYIDTLNQNIPKNWSILLESKEFKVNHVWHLTNYTIKYDRITIVYGKSREKTDITRGRLCSLLTLNWLSLILVE